MGKYQINIYYNNWSCFFINWLLNEKDNFYFNYYNYTDYHSNLFFTMLLFTNELKSKLNNLAYFYILNR